MKKKIRLTETELINLINKIITEKVGDKPKDLSPDPTYPTPEIPKRLSPGAPTGPKAKQQQQPQPQQGQVTWPMIQRCKHLLNNVPGTTLAWKQNFKQTVHGKPCNWIMNRYQFFGNKATTFPAGSGAQKRALAKSQFLECLYGECNS